MLSMGQLSDAGFDFSWRRTNGIKTMRIFNETGTYVECFLQDQCPRLYNVTQAKDADRPADSTVENDASPPLSAIQQSFNPQKAWPSKVASKRCKQKTVHPSLSQLQQETAMLVVPTSLSQMTAVLMNQDRHSLR